MKLAALAPLAQSSAPAQDASAASLRLSFDKPLGPLDIGRIGLGQGGLSADPIWDRREQEIRVLHPAMIRLFVQEYFDLLPEPGTYHFDSLDRSVDLILRTGAAPLLNIDFKPKVLFPRVDQDIVDPTSYEQWEDLISHLVRHYMNRGAGVHHWEIANEPDIGESGGCPYRFQPDNYVRYYQHTAAAILLADPAARVGGPALANVHSPILPALLDFCAAGKAPIHFVSWHIYSSDPLQTRKTIDYVHDLLRKRPSLHVETNLNEWNMALTHPPRDPRFQPCFIAETAWQMKDAGLDYSCYYHIRDYHVDRDRFAKFMSARGASFMARWWNRMPQYDGLFDYQDTIRPSYFLFKLLSRLTGEKLPAVSSDSRVHAFLTWDASYEMFNLLFWNFSGSPVNLNLNWTGLPYAATAKRVELDAATASSIENDRLRPMDDIKIAAGAGELPVALGPWAVQFWQFENPKG